MSVLERVRWPAVLDDLYGGADTDRRQAADWYASRIDAPLAHHARLAVLATTAGPRLLSCLVEAHGREVPAEPVAGWCYWTSRTLFGGLQAEINRPRLTVTDGTGPMHVDPWLPALPLLGVAAEHAARAGQLLVLKAADDLPPAVQGHCGRAVQATIVGRGGQRRAETVTLVQLRRGTSDPGGIWRHELGHVVDPRPGERTSAEGERFADDLAELLAARPPDDLAALDALVVEAEASQAHRPPATAIEVAEPTTPRTGTVVDLPAPGMPSLLAFAALPLKAAA